MGFFGRKFAGAGAVPGARRLGSADLQLVLLALLAEQPAHGYELMRTLEERSGGFYAPSPGMVYPALTYLEEIGHAAVEHDGNRKLYSISKAGHAYLKTHLDQVTAILEMLTRIGGRMPDVREAYAGLGDADPLAADDLARAKYALKDAIARKRGCGSDDLRRIVRILKTAANDILKI
jgi:DNA-binding PadR family transcriptional regulator